MPASGHIDADAILASCPFSFTVDGCGRLNQLGPYFATRHPGMAGRLLFDAFAPLSGIHRESGLPGSRCWRPAPNVRIELELRAPGGIRVVGAFLPFAGPTEGAVFVGTISPQMISRAPDFGLTMGDFAPFDIAPDFAMMAQVNEAVLQDARMLNERLAAAHDAAVRARQTIEEIALLDALSGLANRAAFQQSLEEPVVRFIENGTAATLLLLDIDGFKPVNDRYGHAVGDQLIRSIGERIARVTADDAEAYRIGGDEFAVLFGSATAHDARRRGTEIMQVVRQSHDVHGKQIHVGASGGLARAACRGDELQTLYHAADIALYEAKRSTNRKLQVYGAEMGRRQLEQMLLERDLIEALERRDLEVFVQPQYDIATSQLVGGEALGRWWNRRLQRYVPPSEFIPIAERLGKVSDIDLMVLETVVAEQQSCTGCAWSTNVSPLSIGDGVLERIQAIIARLPPHTVPLEIEITESAVLGGGPKLTQQLRGVRAMGMGIAIDDFGAGQTSLSHLSRMPITRLKVDRSMVEAIDKNKRAGTIMRSIVSLAHELGLRVTAEGVERPSQVRILRSMAPLDVQGFLYAKPMPLAQFRSLANVPLEERRAASV